MNCMNCGNALTGGVKFCPRCGTPAPQPDVYAQPQYQPPPGGQMRGSFGEGRQYQAPPPPQGGQYQAPYGSQPRKKSKVGKILLIVLAVFIVIGVGAGVGVYYIFRYVESSLKDSEAYKLAVRELKESPAAAEHLGEIRETGFPLGNFKETAGGSGNAAFTMSVEGTKGSGQYVVTMSRSGGTWTVTSGYLRLSNGQIIDLAESRGPVGPVPPDPPIGPIGPNANAKTRVPPGIISGGVLEGKVIEKPAPPYPAIAKAARAQGRVIVQVTVDEEGRVISASAVGGHPLLQQAAVTAARQARFTPTLLSGKPVKVSGTIFYDFKLE